MESSPNKNNDDSHEHAMEFSNYDILLAKATDGTIILDSKRPHVGNNRFQVLLNMNRREFEDCLTAGESTGTVVKKIIDIVCTKCEPTGRFLISGGKKSWMVLNKGEVEAFVTEYLMNPESQKSLLSNPNALTGSLPPSSTATNESDVPEKMRATIATTAASDGEKKRRRRSSLLRRSVSESCVDKKKSGRLSIRLPGFLHKFGATRAKPNQLDVIFNSQLSALTTGHTGNNRLAVLINMKRETYQSGGDGEKQKILQELYEAIHFSYKGRFLCEKADSSSFVLLDDGRNQINIALHALLTNPEPVPVGVSPLGPPPTSRDACIKNTSLQALHQVKLSPSDDVQNMRSAAIASLQKRKKRQGLTSRIRALARGTSGTPSIPSEIQRETFMHRTASAPTNLLYPPAPAFTSAQSAPYPSHSQFQAQMEPQPVGPNPLAVTSDPRNSVISEEGGAILEGLLSGLDVSGDLASQIQRPGAT